MENNRYNEARLDELKGKTQEIEISQEIVDAFNAENAKRRKTEKAEKAKSRISRIKQICQEKI